LWIRQNVIHNLQAKKIFGIEVNGQMMFDIINESKDIRSIFKVSLPFLSDYVYSTFQKQISEIPKGIKENSLKSFYTLYYQLAFDQFFEKIYDNEVPSELIAPFLKDYHPNLDQNQAKVFELSLIFEEWVNLSNKMEQDFENFVQEHSSIERDSNSMFYALLGLMGVAVAGTAIALLN